MKKKSLSINVLRNILNTFTCEVVYSSSSELYRVYRSDDRRLCIPGVVIEKILDSGWIVVVVNVDYDGCPYLLIQK